LDNLETFVILKCCNRKTRKRYTLLEAEFGKLPHRDTDAMLLFRRRVSFMKNFLERTQTDMLFSLAYLLVIRGKSLWLS